MSGIIAVGDVIGNHTWHEPTPAANINSATLAHAVAVAGSGRARAAARAVMAGPQPPLSPDPSGRQKAGADVAQRHPSPLRGVGAAVSGAIGVTSTGGGARRPHPARRHSGDGHHHTGCRHMTSMDGGRRCCRRKRFFPACNWRIDFVGYTVWPATL